MHLAVQRHPRHADDVKDFEGPLYLLGADGKQCLYMSQAVSLYVAGNVHCGHDWAAPVPCACMYVSMYVYIYTYVCICVFRYVHTFTYICYIDVHSQCGALA